MKPTTKELLSRSVVSLFDGGEQWNTGTGTCDFRIYSKPDYERNFVATKDAPPVSICADAEDEAGDYAEPEISITVPAVMEVLFDDFAKLPVAVQRKLVKAGFPKPTKKKSK